MVVLLLNLCKATAEVKTKQTNHGLLPCARFSNAVHAGPQHSPERRPAAGRGRCRPARPRPGSGQGEAPSLPGHRRDGSGAIPPATCKAPAASLPQSRTCMLGCVCGARKGCPGACRNCCRGGMKGRGAAEPGWLKCRMPTGPCGCMPGRTGRSRGYTGCCPGWVKAGPGGLNGIGLCAGTG